MKKIDFSKKRWLAISVLLTIANVGLAVFVIRNAFAQTPAEAFRDQPAISAKLALQPESPIQLLVVGTDNSDPLTQSITLSLQNVNTRPIRGYVVLARGTLTGKLATNFYPVDPFQPKQAKHELIEIERENLRPAEVITLSVDFVQFVDGTSWGSNSQKQSDFMAGGISGVGAGIDRLRELIANGEFFDAVSVPLVDLEVPPSGTDLNDNAARGFISGYKGIFAYAKHIRNQPTEEILALLDRVHSSFNVSQRSLQ